MQEATSLYQRDLMIRGQVLEPDHQQTMEARTKHMEFSF